MIDAVTRSDDARSRGAEARETRRPREGISVSPATARGRRVVEIGGSGETRGMLNGLQGRFRSHVIVARISRRVDQLFLDHHTRVRKPELLMKGELMRGMMEAAGDARAQLAADSVDPVTGSTALQRRLDSSGHRGRAVLHVVVRAVGRCGSVHLTAGHGRRHVALIPGKLGRTELHGVER